MKVLLLLVLVPLVTSEEPQTLPETEPQFVYPNSRQGLDSYGAPAAPVQTGFTPGPWRPVANDGYSEVPVYQYGDYEPQYDHRNQAPVQGNSGFGINTGFGLEFPSNGLFNPHGLLVFGLGAIILILLISTIFEVSKNILPSVKDLWRSTEEARSLENASMIAGYVMDAFEKYRNIDVEDN
jgi:hypothetical protein